MKKKTLNNLILTAITIICLGIISGCGGDGGSGSAANNAPAADDMSVITDMDSQVQITLTADDPDDDALAWHIDSDPAHGNLSGTAPDLTFTPEAGYFGIDNFTFYVDDGTKYSNTATVTIQIKSKNILFVDINASGTGDGSLWENAFNHPQDAIDAASAGAQVWVAQGNYYSKNAADPATPVIQFKEEVYVYGGFDGTESGFAERDFENKITILDGNYETYHVVIGAANGLIDGFTVRRGNADGNDHPDYHGGGMYNNDYITISNCKFINNRCNQDGAGIYNSYCSPKITNCTFENNTAVINSNKTNSGGAGIYNWHASSSITGCTFINNQTLEGSGGANGGAAIYNNNNSSAKIENCIFTSNSTYDDSGSNGGAIINYGFYGGSPKITGCVFENNTSHSGGAIYNDNILVVISDCTFSGNEASYYGGALYNYIYTTGESPVIKNCAVYGNTANNDGGGICNYNCSPEIINCTISGNSASSSGGAIYNFSGGSPEIKNCVLSNNTAAMYGGGIYSGSSVTATITNCLIIGNSTETYDGGGICNRSSATVINECTISGNTAHGRGGGIGNYGSSSTPIITNCIIWGNVATSRNELDDNGGSASSVYYTDINKDGYAGSNGNIRSNPFFTNGPLGNYYLSHIAAGQSVNSPCIDTGSDTAENLGLTDRTTRTDSGSDTGVVDMGYHYEQ